MRLASSSLLAAALVALAAARPAAAAEAGGDLDAVRKRGTLIHLGVPYANFVTGGGDGFDVELMAAFARKLGVTYEYRATDWGRAFGDLTGRRVTPAVGVEAAPAVPVLGDVLANGVTLLPWREKAAAFSDPYFPTQVWVMARSDAPLQPIRPTGKLEKDIELVRGLLAKRSLLTVPSTCLDAALYDLGPTGARVVVSKLALNEVAPVLLKGESELALLDVADAMIALSKWPGKLKVIGPISELQDMGVVFRRDAPQLRAAFNQFLAEARRDGTYARLVARYFPEAPQYFPEALATRVAGAR